MIDKIESSIMSTWLGKDVEVSICVLTYNHEKYIEQALDSILMQETNFAFEVLVHDDASTDNTAGILEQYQEHYPHIIKLILQKENQYSKGIKINPSFNFSRATGKLIAVCDGDDYWTDPKKLQIQRDMMLQCDIGLSFHLNSELHENGEIRRPKALLSNKQYSLSEIIRADFHLVQTNTVMFAKEALKNLNYDILPSSPVGDLWTRIATSMPHGALLINRDMAVYRVQCDGSWSDSMKDGKDFIDFVDKMIQSINIFDEYWKYEYTKDFFFLKNMFVKSLMINSSVNDTLKENFFHKMNGEISIKNKILWHFFHKTHIMDYLRYLKHWIRKRND